MTLLNPSETDSEGNTQAFSIASAPQEDAVMFATRMRDTAFKRTLKNLPLGTPVKIEGPFGNPTLHTNATKPVYCLRAAFVSRHLAVWWIAQPKET